MPYIYQADEYHDRCVIAEMVQIGELPKAALDMVPHEALHHGAVQAGIDMRDERTYDSDEWPKEIGPNDDLTNQDSGRARTCGGCLEPLEDEPDA